MDKRYSPDRYKHYSTIKFEEKELKKIKVEIKRKIPTVEFPSQELDHSVDKLDEIKIYRSAGEGSRPIFARQDIIVNREDTEHRTVSAHSPQRSSPVRNRSSSRSPRRYSHKSEYPRRQQNDPGSSNSNNRGSPYRIASSSRHQRDNNNSPRRIARRDRSRSKSNETNRRTRRSRTRSPRRESERRHGTRSPDRESRRRERDEYHRSERDRNSRSPRYTRRSSSRSRSTHVDSTPFLLPILPPDINFYRVRKMYSRIAQSAEPENALWIHAPLRPPMMVPPGMMPPRGGPYGMYGLRPPLPRLPYQHMQRPPRPNRQQ